MTGGLAGGDDGLERSSMGFRPISASSPDSRLFRTALEIRRPRTRVSSRPKAASNSALRPSVCARGIAGIVQVAEDDASAGHAAGHAVLISPSATAPGYSLPAASIFAAVEPLHGPVGGTSPSRRGCATVTSPVMRPSFQARCVPSPE